MSDKKIKIKITSIENIEIDTTEYHVIADTGNKNDGGKLYGYVPVKRIKEVESELLIMEVNSLDIKKVFQAIIND